MQWLIVPFVVLTGALNTVQSGANAQLAKTLGQPWWAAVAVYLTGLCGLAVALASLAVLGRGAVFPGWDRAAGVPWWAWTGGLLGASYVMAMLLFAEQLGAGLFTGLTVTAAVVTSVALDHFGLVGFREHPVNLWRVVGAGLMVVGTGLIAKF